MDSLLLLFTVAKSFLAILLLQFIKLFNLSHPPGRHSLKNEVDNMFATSSQGCLCGIDYVTNNLKIYLCWCFWFGLATEVRRPSLGWIWTDIKWNGKIDRWSRGKSLSLLVAHRSTQCISMFLWHTASNSNNYPVSAGYKEFYSASVQYSVGLSDPLAQIIWLICLV